jgi:hypothetical protein
VQRPNRGFRQLRQPGNHRRLSGGGVFPDRSPLTTTHRLSNRNKPALSTLACALPSSEQTPKQQKKLEILLTPHSSTISKFLIDNFCHFQRSRTSIGPLSLAAVRSMRSGPGRSCAPLSPSQTCIRQRKLEILLTPRPSTTSKFLIDNFCHFCVPLDARSPAAEENRSSYILTCSMASAFRLRYALSP